MNINIDQRIQSYRDVLRSNPVYDRSIRQFEMQHPDMREDTRLYLCAMVPSLMEFVEWVLSEALKSGKKRLYFLARDGYSMYLAAKYLCRERNLDLECRYLRVSRYAMRVPEYHLLGEKCLDRICIGGIDVTFKKIMRRAGLGKSEGKRIAGMCGWESDYQRILNYQEIMELKNQLAGNEQLMNAIYQHSKNAYSEAVGYLRQEGLCEEIPYALVDSGWVGTLQQTIGHLLQSQGITKPVEGYYFGLYEIPADEAKEQYHSYYFTPKSGLRRKVHFSNSLFESIFSAPQGMTLRYRQENGSYLPVEGERLNIEGKQLEQNIAALQEYFPYYEKEKKAENHNKKSSAEQSRLAFVEQLLTTFMSRPTALEVTCYGANLFSDDVLEDETKPVSAQLSEQEIKNQRFWNKLGIIIGMRKEPIRESAWIEGSIVKNGAHIRQNLRHAIWYKYVIYIRKQWKSGVLS